MMKITSGIYKYRNIEVPNSARPTTGKVREAVFSMVGAWIPGANVLDLFAGSGAMGLEALSRGAAHCVFCESDRKTQKILSGNIKNCGAEDVSELISRDFRAALSDLAAAPFEKKTFDIVIIDPPYGMTEYYDEAMELLGEYGMVCEGGIVIAEHLYDNKLPETCGSFRRIKEKRYGTTGVDVYML